MDSSIKLQKREISGKKCKALRRDGLVPGVLYGLSQESKMFSVDKENLKSILKNNKTATPFNVAIDKTVYKVIVKDIQRDVINEDIIHIDLLSIKEGQTVVVKIPVRLEGVSPAVKNGWGVIMQALSRITVKAKADKIVPFFTIDISKLERIGDNISVSDIELPEGITVVNETERKKTIVTIATFQKVIEEKAEEETETEFETEEGEEDGETPKEETKEPSEEKAEEETE